MEFLGHAFLCTFLSLRPTITCVRPNTTASILDASEYKSLKTSGKQLLSSSAGAIMFLKGQRVYESKKKGIAFTAGSHGTGYLSTVENTKQVMYTLTLSANFCLATQIPTNSCGLWNKTAILASSAQNNEQIISKCRIFIFRYCKSGKTKQDQTESPLV